MSLNTSPVKQNNININSNNENNDNKKFQYY
jgi:hypothetical protein